MTPYQLFLSGSCVHCTLYTVHDTYFHNMEESLQISIYLVKTIFDPHFTLLYFIHMHDGWKQKVKQKVDVILVFVSFIVCSFLYLLVKFDVLAVSSQYLLAYTEKNSPLVWATKRLALALLYQLQPGEENSKHRYKKLLCTAVASPGVGLLGLGLIKFWLFNIGTSIIGLH